MSKFTFKSLLFAKYPKNTDHLYLTRKVCRWVYLTFGYATIKTPRAELSYSRPINPPRDVLSYGTICWTECVMLDCVLFLGKLKLPWNPGNYVSTLKGVAQTPDFQQNKPSKPPHVELSYNKPINLPRAELSYNVFRNVAITQSWNTAWYWADFHLGEYPY
jgi:hypothetical protein